MVNFTNKLLTNLRVDQTYLKLNDPQRMSDSVYFGDMMRTLHKILAELESMNKKLDKINSNK